MKVSCNKNGIRIATESIKNGGIVVYPTDTVYGIGCDPYNENAVKRIYQIKNREAGKPFPILGESKEALSKIVVFDRISEKLANTFWPGQLTMILELRDLKLKKSLDLGNKIAVRVPSNNCILGMLRECKLLVGTSANYSGHGSFMDPNKCELKNNDYDVFVDGGIIESHGESTIIELEDDRIIIHRQGSISRDNLEKML